MPKKLEVIKETNYNEYWGPMTYIRVAKSGEHIQDDNGLVLHLCGLYDDDLLDRIVKALEG